MDGDLGKHFKIIKDRLCSDRVLVPFDTKRRSRVYCDASPYRTQATVAQRYEEDGEVRWRPVANTARSWSEVEARYGQVERESNRVLHSITSNKMYVLGQEFVCVVDHKPLLPLYNQLKRPIQARVDRHRMKLAQFNFKLVYEKGSMNPCDYGSRHPGKHHEEEEDDSEIYINRVVEELLPAAVTRKMMRKATDADTQLQMLKEDITEGRCRNSLHRYA